MISSYKHGYAPRKNRNYFYDVWGWMKSRCCNPNDTQYKNYGGRGISICDEWKNDPVAFIEWCKKSGWENGLVLDRIDNDGNYEPLNCRFVTRTISSANQRIRKDNTSGYRGVHWNKRDNGWIGRIQVNKKRVELCYEKTAKQAAIMRDLFIIKHDLRHPLAFPGMVKEAS